MGSPPTELPEQLLAGLARAVDARFDAVKQAYLANLAIPSVLGEPAPGAPFGVQVARALRHVQGVCESLGLATGGQAGQWCYGETGAGDACVAAVGHLDVVPPGDGWTRPPFEPCVVGDRVFARGAADDKGGSFAALLAVAAIHDLIEAGALRLPRRVRVLFGGDEETQMRCVQHYVAHASGADLPVFAIAPDFAGPIARAEKGFATVVLEGAAPAGGSLFVARLAAGTRDNVVPDRATAELAGTPDALAAAEAMLADYWDRNVTFRRQGQGLAIEAIGLGGHAARAFLADSAAIRILRVLAVLPLEGRDFWLGALTLSDPLGGGLGLADYDPFSKATARNLGIVDGAAGRLRLTFNTRYAVRRDPAWVEQRVDGAIAPLGLSRVATRHMPPLNHAADSPLIRTLVDVYSHETGRAIEAVCNLARSYASYVPHCTAVGRDWPAPDETGVHAADESYTLSSLRGAGRMLAHMLIRLALQEAWGDPKENR